MQLGGLSKSGPDYVIYSHSLAMREHDADEEHHGWLALPIHYQSHRMPEWLYDVELYIGFQRKEGGELAW